MTLSDDIRTLEGLCDMDRMLINALKVSIAKFPDDSEQANLSLVKRREELGKKEELLWILRNREV